MLQTVIAQNDFEPRNYLQEVLSCVISACADNNGCASGPRDEQWLVAHFSGRGTGLHLHTGRSTPAVTTRDHTHRNTLCLQVQDYADGGRRFASAATDHVAYYDDRDR